MKIYIVTQGDYSDYRIDRVFLDLEKAKAHASMICTSYEEARVEIYDTFDESVEVSDQSEKRSKIIFRFTFVKNYVTDEWQLTRREGYLRFDDEEIPNVQYDSNYFGCNLNLIYVYIAEPDEEKAWKILYDDIAKTKAQKEGL